MGKTLRRYLLREIGAAFLAGIAAFSSILFLMRVLGLIEMIFARGVPWALVLRLLVAILPSFLEATLPMAFLLGVIVALGRLSADHEAVAMRAAGLGILQMLPPVVAMGAAVSAATLALSMTARPWGHREIERTGFEIARTRASAALKPRFFNTEFQRMVMYVDRIDPATGSLGGVLLSDERGRGARSTVFAREGRVGGHEDSGRLYLQLFDGTSVTTRENAADADVTRFRTLEVNLELRTGSGATTARDEPATLDWGEIRTLSASGDARAAREAIIEEQRRLAISAAALALGVLGAALGLHPLPATRSRAAAVGIGVILAFYALLTFSVSAARSGALPATLAPWIPDLLLAAIAAWSLRRAATDRPLWPRLVRAGARG